MYWNDLSLLRGQCCFPGFFCSPPLGKPQSCERTIIDQLRVRGNPPEELISLKVSIRKLSKCYVPFTTMEDIKIENNLNSWKKRYKQCFSRADALDISIFLLDSKHIRTDLDFISSVYHSDYQNIWGTVKSQRNLLKCFSVSSQSQIKQNFKITWN